MGEFEILKLWENPSFGPNLQWIITYNRETKSHYLRQIKGPRQPYHELIKKDWFEDAKHLIYRGTEIDESILFEWLNNANDIAIPLINVNPLVGYDGVSYGFEWKKYDATSKLVWWSDGPSEWKLLIDWYHDFVTWLKLELNKVDI